MAATEVRNAQLAQGPSFALAMGTGATIEPDFSGNGNNFTATGAKGTAATLLDPIKNVNPLASDVVSGDYWSRALPANTNSKLMDAAGGAEIEFFYQCSTTTSDLDVVDTNIAGVGNGFTIRFNGESTSTKLVLYFSDSLGVYSSYKVTDTSGYAFWNDGLKHRFVLQFKAKTANHGADAAGNEVCRLWIDRTEVTLTDNTPAGQRACRGAGVFSDHGSTMVIGKQASAAVYWVGKLQNIAFYPRFRTVAERRAVWSAATYDIGDGVGSSLNGVVDIDARQPMYTGAALTGVAVTGNRIGSVPNQYDIYLGNSGANGQFTNSAADATCPKLFLTPNNKRAIYFDNFNQNSKATHRQFLRCAFSAAYQAINAYRFAHSAYCCARTVRLIGVGQQHVATFSLNSGGGVLGTEDAQALGYYLGQPAVVARGSTLQPTTGTTFPYMPCVPGPALLVASWGEGSLTAARMTAFKPGTGPISDGSATPVSTSYAAKSHLTLGCWQAGVNGFDGLLYRYIFDGPISDADAAIRSAYLDTLSGTVRRAHITVGCTSIETGNPAGTEATQTDDTSLGWTGKLNSTLYGLVSCYNLSVGGSYSGPMFDTAPATGAFPGNGSFPGNLQGFDSPGAYAAGIQNLTVFEAFTNDVNANNARTAADNSAQSIANVNIMIAQATTAIGSAPKVGIMMYPTDATGVNVASVMAVALTAYYASHIPSGGFVYTPNGMPDTAVNGWVHPTGGLANSITVTDNYQYIATGSTSITGAGGISGKIAAALGLNISSGNAGPRQRDRLSRR